MGLAFLRVLQQFRKIGSVSRDANGICNLQILKGAESARSARTPNRSCKSFANFIFVL